MRFGTFRSNQMMGSSPMPYLSKFFIVLRVKFHFDDSELSKTILNFVVHYKCASGTQTIKPTWTNYSPLFYVHTRVRYLQPTNKIKCNRTQNLSVTAHSI